jgi:hypothetical protein
MALSAAPSSASGIALYLSCKLLAWVSEIQTVKRDVPFEPNIGVPIVPSHNLTIACHVDLGAAENVQEGLQGKADGKGR